MKLLVGGVEHPGEVVLPEAFRFSFAAPVQHGAVDQPRAITRPVADQTATETRTLPAAVTDTTGVTPRGAQVVAFLARNV
ncbi:hypothetical protein [Dactylosporangium sp. NPDC050588]|uniref:hypothetical protein n=1 Tax=Dactylosporangium sp. NPDC050588 TaxID=3157211 RepID=UPI0033E1ECC5